MSLEDLYRDLAVSKEEGVLNVTPLPDFTFPSLPEALTTLHDTENWKILGEVLNECNGHVATLDKVVSQLVSASDKFRYIGDSVRWMKTELERMCEMPPLVAEESETSSDSEWLSEDEAVAKFHDRTATSDDLEPDAKPTSAWWTASDAERLFRHSDMYDWSEIEEDVHMLQEIILMNPMMAIYEILEFKIISDRYLDELFAQRVITNWDGEMVETLLECLDFLSKSFLKLYDPKLTNSPLSMEDTETNRLESARAASPQPYPSPKMADAHEIRILELLPGAKNQPVHGLLTIEHLWDDPRYEALSYAWGASATMKSIRLNETDFEITPNLETALLHLRDEKETRRLWVDALCINQSDPIEKQGQVQLMSEIYPAAENVLCWLGPEADDSDFVFQKLQEIASSKKTPSESDSDNDDDSDSSDD